MPSRAERFWQPERIISIAASVPGAGSALSASSREIPASSSICRLISTCVFSPPRRAGLRPELFAPAPDLAFADVVDVTASIVLEHARHEEVRQVAAVGYELAGLPVVRQHLHAAIRGALGLHRAKADDRIGRQLDGTTGRRRDRAAPDEQ